MTRCLSISYGVLPPSDNHIRDVGYTQYGGKRHAMIRYTTEALNYKKLVVRHINDAYFIEVQKFVREHKPWTVYELSFIFVFPSDELLTAGWLKGTTKSPYKRVDTTNRRKLLEDALAEAIGIDDSLFWEGHGVKLVGGDSAIPEVHMILEEADPERYGVPTPYLRDLRG
jgi:hypothetical protein